MDEFALVPEYVRLKLEQLYPDEKDGTARVEAQEMLKGEKV